eukprot:tig00020510_g9812.t1
MEQASECYVGDFKKYVPFKAPDAWTTPTPTATATPSPTALPTPDPPAVVTPAPLVIVYTSPVASSVVGVGQELVVQYSFASVFASDTEVLLVDALSSTVRHPRTLHPYACFS